jgi:hypothetical protein
MYLPAISIGYAVPTEDFDASVHSVFQSALNLRLNGQDNLLTLLTSRDGDLPLGIRLKAPDDFSFEHFQAGEAAFCRDGILYFEKNSLTVQLSNSRRWKCDLAALNFDPADPAVSAAWSLVWDMLNKRQTLIKADIIAGDLLHSNESLRTGVLGKAHEGIHCLMTATRRFDLADISSVSSLIGLGSGLTPSGDDLLVGYLAGLWCTTKDRSARAKFITGLAKTIIDLSGKTNDISRTYLYHAAQGQVSSRLSDLAEAICRGKNPERLSDIAEAAMNLGHTSGLDTVTGLLIGLAVWDGDQLLSM